MTPTFDISSLRSSLVVAGKGMVFWSMLTPLGPSPSQW